MFCGFNIQTMHHAVLAKKNTSTEEVIEDLIGKPSGQKSGTNTYLPDDEVMGYTYVAFTSGEVRGGELAVNTSSATKKSIMLIYNSSESLLATSDEVTGDTGGIFIYVFSGVDRINVTATTTYRVCFWGDNSMNVPKADNGSIPYDGVTYGDAAPNPFSSDGTENIDNGFYITVNGVAS